MKFKRLFLITCLVICLFTMASVCAGEANDTATDSQDILEINEDNQVIGNDNALGEVDSTDNNSGNDNVEIPAPETADNSDSDKLGISDDDLVGADLRANVIALNVTAQDNTLFVVDCADDFKGNVLIRIGDNELYDGNVSALIEASKLPAGNYVATAVFYGDGTYGNWTVNDIGFTVSRVTPTIDVEIDDVCYPRIAYAIVHVGNNANGTVNATIGNIRFNGTVSNGEGYVRLFGLSAGFKNAEIEFLSTDYYNDNVNASAKFIVYPNNSLINVKYETNQFNVGDDIELKINTQNSTGDLSVYINGVIYQNAIPYPSHRDYDLAISDKSEGSYAITFKLDGDENYTSYETSTTVYVVKKDISIDIIDIDEVIRVDSPVTFTAKLNNTVSGNVIFIINGVNYTEHVDNSDVVTHIYTPANNDTITVVAIFEGDNMYKANISDSKDFNVARISTAIDVDFYSPIIAGDDAQFSVFMNPDITCVVKLIVGGKFYDVAIVEGMGMYTVSNLANSTFDVMAVFAGDDRYADSTSDVKQLFVNQVHTNLNISIDKTSMSYNDSAVVSIVLDQSINAVVTVKVNGRNHTVGLVNGKGSFTVYDLDKDNYTINAVFAGDDKYIESTSNALNLTVTGDNIVSSVSVSLNKDSVFVGDNVIVKVESNPTVTGIIRLNIGSDSYDVAVNRGVGTFTISDLANGNYDVQAIFDGDNKHSGSSSDVKHLEVKRIPTNLSVSVDNPSIFVGDSVVVCVTLNQPINNVITVNVNDKAYIIGIVNGTGNLTLSGLTFGTYNINATFAVDGKCAESSSDNVTLVVNKIKTQLAGDAITTDYNVNKDLVITLKDSNGKPVSGADLIVNLNGVKTLKTNNNGQVKISTNALVPNGYSAKITFAGNSVYDKSSMNVRVIVKKATPKIDAKSKTFKVKVKTKKYAVTLKDNTGNAIKNAKLTLKVKGKSYSATTNSKGVATFKITNLNKKGSYKASITYGESKLYNKATANGKIKVK